MRPRHEVPAERYAEGVEALHLALAAARARALAPPPKLTLSQWAERYAVLSKETSAQTGRFVAFGYQKGVMDAITDPGVEQIVVKKSARVGYTKILDHAVGYYVHQDPSPMLLVQPRTEDAEDYSKTEISPMLRDTPVLAELCPDAKSRDTAQTILRKSFLSGSSLTLTGANSPGGFRRITVRVVIIDEADGMPVGGAGAEGDQVRLAFKRSETFWNRKLIVGSTPTRAGASRIDSLWEGSDQRRYHVPCPHCGTRQFLKWGGADVPYGVKWEKSEDGSHLPETAHYVCEGQACRIDPAELPWMDARGEWVASKPFRGVAGFHIWSGMSLFPNAAWPKLAEEWLEAKKHPLTLQTFVNLVLGEAYEDRGDVALSENTLAARTEIWAAEVPDGVALVTAGVDTQDGRFEVEFVGWGANEESWSLGYEIVDGDPDDPDTIASLDAVLNRRFVRADGHEFRVSAACIDSGGHRTQAVYAFSKSRLSRRIWAIKGEAARGGQRSPVWPTKRPSNRSKQSFKPIILGVNAAKDVIRSRLALEKPPYGVPCPGYMHFPSDRDINFFAQLLSENLVSETVGGTRVRLWKARPGRASEALDCRVYAYAALCGLLHAIGPRLNAIAAHICPSPGEPALPAPAIEDVAPVPDASYPQAAGFPPPVAAPLAQPRTSPPPAPPPRQPTRQELMRARVRRMA